MRFFFVGLLALLVLLSTATLGSAQLYSNPCCGPIFGGCPAGTFQAGANSNFQSWCCGSSSVDYEGGTPYGPPSICSCQVACPASASTTAAPTSLVLYAFITFGPVNINAAGSTASTLAGFESNVVTAISKVFGLSYDYLKVTSGSWSAATNGATVQMVVSFGNSTTGFINFLNGYYSDVFTTGLRMYTGQNQVTVVIAERTFNPSQAKDGGSQYSSSAEPVAYTNFLVVAFTGLFVAWLNAF